MSTPTENDLRDEGTERGRPEETGTASGSDTAQEHRHEHHHDHTHDDGELSPMCVGGGCVTKTPA
ncbi:hypothetical protein ACIGNX_12870 [Actinosynnema sp. NPDC053489]|uniref:hypothetical protein n=1 Tax=Actinosynnema sp. NPDC053489 TaxID=3363916 RepID=UPI0037C66645